MAIKSQFKVDERTWLDTKASVKHLKTRKLCGYIASNESPQKIDIMLTGANDMGIVKDIIIDVPSLLKALEQANIIGVVR